MLKKREQARDAANGVVRDDKILRKLATAKQDVNCRICGTVFKLTKKNVDARQHTESKHPGKPFAECFPDIIKAEADDKKAAAPVAKKNVTKKKDDSAALLSEGLAGAIKKR